MSEQSITLGARLIRDLERALEAEFLRGFAAGRVHNSEAQYLGKRFENAS